MSKKMQNLERMLKDSSGKPNAPILPEQAVAPEKPARQRSREGKEYLGIWLQADFIASLRLTQLKRPRDLQGKRIYLDDLVAEALNELFRKYDVPTVIND